MSTVSCCMCSEEYPEGESHDCARLWGRAFADDDFDATPHASSPQPKAESSRRPKDRESVRTPPASVPTPGAALAVREAVFDALGAPPLLRAVLDEAEAVLARRPSRCVYFLRGTKARGPIKIGYTARQVMARVRECAIQYPYPLEVLGTLQGEPPLEREIHRRFAHLRLRGEWFEPADELLEFIRNSTSRP